MEGNSENKKDGYESGYESDLENQEEIKKAATKLMRRSSELSPEGRNIIGDFAVADVFDDTGIYQTPSNQPIYDVPRKVDNKSGNETPPTLSLPSNSNFQQHFNNGLRALNSNSANKNEISDAVDRAAEIVFSTEGQKKLKSKIENDPSFVKEQLTKFNKLSNKDKSLFGLGVFGIAVGAPIVIAALPALLTVAVVAGLSIAIIDGLKLATPSKAEFKKTGQEIMHSAKNAANVLPGKTNLEKLWKSVHQPAVTAKNPNLETFLTQYCFPDQKSNGKTEVRFDSDKVEALKYAVKEVGLDIDRMVRKGESKISSDNVQSSQAQGNEDNKFIATVEKIADAVMEKHNSPDPNNPFVGIQDIFKDKLNEIKQTKAEKEAAKKENSFSNKIRSKLPSFNRNSSYARNVEEERRGNDSSQERSI